MAVSVDVQVPQASTQAGAGSPGAGWPQPLPVELGGDRWLLRQAVRRVLTRRRRAEAPGDADDRGRFTAADANRLADEAWQRSLAAPWRTASQVKLALFEALVADGLDRAYAMDLTWEISRTGSILGAASAGFGGQSRDEAGDI